MKLSTQNTHTHKHTRCNTARCSRGSKLWHSAHISEGKSLNPTRQWHGVWVIPWLLKDIFFIDWQGRITAHFFFSLLVGCAPFVRAHVAPHTGSSGIYNNVLHLCVWFGIKRSWEMCLYILITFAGFSVQTCSPRGTQGSSASPVNQSLCGASTNPECHHSVGCSANLSEGMFWSLFFFNVLYLPKD